VKVTLSAADVGGSTVAGTYYTTDGSTPTTTSTRYTDPFTVSQNTTVKYFSVDTKGNAEAVRQQLIQFDSVAPTVNVTAPLNGSSIRRGTIAVVANASDTGSGVARVAFAVDGTQIGTDTTPEYTANWNARKASLGQHTLTAVATDGVGNVTTSQPVTVTITR
jgi:hypothetical protein